VLAPLQITRGGPIIMAQVENEYGFFGKDAQYMEEIRKALVDAGFEVPLFECNPPDLARNGMLTNLLQAADFGGDARSNFAKLRKVQSSGPQFGCEYYSGWFDTWGQRHHSAKSAMYLGDLEYMLAHDESFSLYLAHGGTTFGLWAGSDRPFRPDTSSYDYSAPISEAGWATPQFFQMRGLFAKHLLPGEQLAELPAQNPVICFAPVELTRTPKLGRKIREMPGSATGWEGDVGGKFAHAGGRRGAHGVTRPTAPGTRQVRSIPWPTSESGLKLPTCPSARPGARKKPMPGPGIGFYGFQLRGLPRYS
jgi:hypothetical protein